MIQILLIVGEEQANWQDGLQKYFRTTVSSDIEKFHGFLPEWVFSNLNLRINGYESVITSGEARKIALVKALLSKGDILIPDEAFTYMDNADIEKFISFIP